MNTRFRILLVSEYFPPDVKGGGELSAELLASNLTSAGHEVHVLTSGDGTTSESEGIVVHRLLRTAPHTSIQGNLRRMVVFPREVRREVRRLQRRYHFSVIHYLNAVSLLGALRSPRQAATINSNVALCPKGNRFYREREPCIGCSYLKSIVCLSSSEYVGLVRMPWWLRFNPLFHTLLYANYLRFQAALGKVRPIAVSHDIARQLERLGFPGAAVIPHFPTRGIPPAKKAASSTVRILFLGSLEKQKGVGLLFRAYAALPPETRLKSRLEIVGTGSLHEELNRNAPEGVMFLGKLPHKEAMRHLSGCDIVVLSSLLPEPLSRVLLDALSLGKPVIATDVGGNPDAVADGVNGRIVSLSSDNLTEALEGLINDSSLRRRFGRASLKRFKDMFSEKSVLARLESFYAELTVSVETTTKGI